MNYLRIVSALSHLREVSARTNVRRWLLVLATVGFLIATSFAVMNLPRDLGPIDWASLIVAAVLVFPVAWLLGLEFREIAAIAGHVVSPFSAFRVAMLASASNILPIPGAIAVKTGTLVSAGKRTGPSLASNLVVALFWVATALIIGAFFALPTSQLVAWSSLLAGTGLLLLGMAGLRRSEELRPAARMLRVLAIETALTGCGSVRIWFVMVGIGVEPSAIAAVWLVVVSVISTVVGLFPAGLGLREGLSAAVGPLIGVDPSAAILVAAVDRVVRMGMLAALGGAVSLLHTRHAA